MAKDLPIIGKNKKEEIIKEEVTLDHETKTSAKAVGLPDDLDVKNIETILRNYEIARPGEIKKFVQLAREESENLKNDFGSNSRGVLKGTESGTEFRRAVTMPIGLFRQIEEAYPLMFTNKKHLHWFMKKFPMFTVARKI
jgi:hypothetical protein